MDEGEERGWREGEEIRGKKKKGKGGGSERKRGRKEGEEEAIVAQVLVVP